MKTSMPRAMTGAFWRIYVRMSLFLWGFLAVGLLLFLIFGEIGLVLSVLLYLVVLTVAARILLDEYRRVRSGSNQESNSYGAVIFALDALGGAAAFLDIVLETAATKYGHSYVLMGGLLVFIACVLWANALMLAFREYIQAEHKLVPSLLVAFTLFEILLAFALLLQPASFWTLRS